MSRPGMRRYTELQPSDDTARQQGDWGSNELGHDHERTVRWRHETHDEPEMCDAECIALGLTTFSDNKSTGDAVERLARAMHLARLLPDMEEPYCDNPLTKADIAEHMRWAEAILHAARMLPPYDEEIGV